LNSEESKWLSGRAFIAWLEREYSFQPTTWWRDRERVSVWSADTLLTRLDLHLSMVPDHVWIDPNRREKAPLKAVKRREHPGPRGYPKPLREAVIAKRRAGAKPKALEAEFGIARRTINHWMNETKQKVAH
jgi:hypothetical protein